MSDPFQSFQALRDAVDHTEGQARLWRAEIQTLQDDLKAERIAHAEAQGRVTAMELELQEAHASIERLEKRIAELSPQPQPQPEPEPDPGASLHLDAIEIDAGAITYRWASNLANPLLEVWPTRGTRLPRLVRTLEGEAGSARVTLTDMRAVWDQAAPGWEISARIVRDGAESPTITETIPQPPAPQPQPQPPIVVHPSGEPFPADRILRSGRTYTGRLVGATLRFAADATDVTISHAVLDDVHLLATDGSQYKGLRIAHTRFINFRKRSTGASGIANIYFTIANHDTVIHHCEFSDSDEYAMVLYHVHGGGIQDCVFRDVRQGAHINNVATSFEIVRNLCTRLDRMGFEVQDHGGRTQSLLVAHNVIHSWRRPYNDAFGLSIACQSTDPGAVMVRDNYLAATRVGDWYPNQLKRFGYGIELAGNASVCKGNTIIGRDDEPFVVGVGVSGLDAIVRDNRFYGPTPAWGWITPTPRGEGKGSFTASNNVIELDPDKAPQAPVVD